MNLTLTRTVMRLLRRNLGVALVFRPRRLGVIACLLALLGAGLMAGHDPAAPGMGEPVQTFAAEVPSSAPVSPARELGADCAVQAYCSGFLLALAMQDDAFDPGVVRLLETLEIPYGRTTAPGSPPPKRSRMA